MAGYLTTPAAWVIVPALIGVTSFLVLLFAGSLLHAIALNGAKGVQWLLLQSGSPLWLYFVVIGLFAYVMFWVLGFGVLIAYRELFRMIGPM